MTHSLPFAWILTLSLLAQVLLFRYGVFWGGYGLLAVHLYGLLRMPVGWPPVSYLIVGAGTGLVMDLVCFTGGMHMAAGATLGMAYPSIMRAVEQRDGLRPGHVMSPFDDGWRRYAVFVAVGVGMHWVVMFGLQNGGELIGRTMGQTIASTVLNVGVFLLLQGLTNRPKKQGSSNGAYPWS